MFWQKIIAQLRARIEICSIRVTIVYTYAVIMYRKYGIVSGKNYEKQFFCRF